jgi:tetratricopeptide (TPR) repeat protein
VQHPEQSQKNIDLAEQVLAYKNTSAESSHCQLNTTSITAQKGVNAVLLKDYARALDLLNTGLNTYAPFLLRGRARLIAQKAEAYYGLGYIDESVSAAQEAFGLASSIGSQKTIARVKSLSTLLNRSPYRMENSVAQLGRILATN